MLRMLIHIFPLLILSLLSVDAVSPDFYWRDYIRGQPPPHDAFEGAPGRYIGQIHHIGNEVGTIFPGNNITTIKFLGPTNSRHDIKIFCTRHPNRFYWEYVDFNASHTTQMKEAVKGGYQTNLGVFDLFIGKVFHENEWKIGKVVEIKHLWEGLWVWANPDYIRLWQFQLLKYNLTAESSTDYACAQSSYSVS